MCHCKWLAVSGLFDWQCTAELVKERMTRQIFILITNVDNQFQLLTKFKHFSLFVQFYAVSEHWLVSCLFNGALYMSTIYSQILCYWSVKKENKNFWEQIIASFPFTKTSIFYNTQTTSNSSVVCGTCILSLCSFMCLCPLFWYKKMRLMGWPCCLREEPGSGESDWESEWMSENESQQGHSPSYAKWIVVVTTTLSERRSHSKICKILRRTKIWSWVPKGSETENDCAGEGQQ
jgi:hypothetical protein